MSIYLKIQPILRNYHLIPIPESGKVVIRDKGPFAHTGIIIGKDLKGIIWMIHHGRERGTKLITFDEFASGQEILFLDGSTLPREQVVLRAIRLLENPKPYDLLSWNCQHFTSLAATGRKESTDLQSWGSAAAVVIGSLFVYNLLDENRSA